jgi:tetratricopeptide (TPR) repeat protein
MVTALGESYTSISDYVVYVFRLNDSRMITALGESYTSISDYVVYIFRPNDSRMVVALGESYEKLERLQEAKKCFRKAHSIGDLEGTAIIKLAKYVCHLYNILNLSKV